MNIILACSSRKDPKSRIFARGVPITFAATRPSGIPNVFRPDDCPLDAGIVGYATWRDIVVALNKGKAVPGIIDNMLPLTSLYTPTYHLPNNPLTSIYHYDNVACGGRLYVLSAGWGLMPASFRLPDYNISFSDAVRRTPAFRSVATVGFARGAWKDFIPTFPNNDLIHVCVGNSYLHLLRYVLTGHTNVTVHYFGSQFENPPAGWQFCPRCPFGGNQHTWYYRCAHAIATAKH